MPSPLRIVGEVVSHEARTAQSRSSRVKRLSFDDEPIKKINLPEFLERLANLSEEALSGIHKVEKLQQTFGCSSIRPEITRLLVAKIKAIPSSSPRYIMVWTPNGTMTDYLLDEYLDCNSINVETLLATARYYWPSSSRFSSRSST